MLSEISFGFIYLVGLALIPLSNYAQDSPQDYVNAHNVVRSEVGVAPIIWNDTVAVYARDYAYQRTEDCTAEYSHGPYGENLANWSGSVNLSGTYIINKWASERLFYDYDSNSCTKSRCGNYTQIVWQDSHYLGCAKAPCKDGGHVFYCNYDPPGNLAGQRPYVNNPPAASPAPVPEAKAPQPDSPSPSVSPNPQALTPNSPSVPPHNTEAEKRRTLLVILIVGASVVIVGPVVIWIVLRWKRKLHKNEDVFVVSFGDEFEDGKGPKKFSYRELADATNNFGEELKLGEGGFGAVFKGFLKNMNIFVAVKKISRQSKQGSKEYKTEVNIISRLRHRNTVKLIGWSHEKELILVYEFMPNGSLDSHLFKGKSVLPWMVRYKIVQDVASALLYLHEEGDHCVLHRDIKSSNIMLDSDFKAKLGDFGLARLVGHSKGSKTTGFAGTVGYMAPECLTALSKASKQSDIYSFGVVVLEVACGRRSIEHNCEEDQISLVPWVWESYGNRRILDNADSKLCMNFHPEQMECLMIVGLWCAHPDRNLRPSIRQVIQVLNFELPLPELPPKMPVPRYDMPTATIASSGNQPSQSLTILR
ncbi:L-type lectin-domain containing receptor kinase IX.2-like [Mangifera indica]|uniref:L-type lectin-domain containing receptor kinase IX.2-like n=1 Tax=Mangifera indica TaxID=29780 RepID=UPI001CFADEE9|nr:L-type lectin-domain containing receptor kinase IX.2-like [Mangifera indica]